MSRLDKSRLEMFATSAWKMAQTSPPDAQLRSWIQVSNWFYGVAMMGDADVSDEAFCLSSVAMERAKL